jgi:nitrate/TMAO reductase-like tetraheme cytochrome c subunit
MRICILADFKYSAPSSFISIFLIKSGDISVTIKQSSPRKKSFRLMSVLVGIVALGIFLAASGFTYAASQETHDPFCASCHTEPESTFFQRSTDAQAVDLASYHTTQQTRCIDCHSGQGVLGRMQAELLGARNTVAWYTDTAIQPAKLTIPIQDAHCLKCHQDVVQRGYKPKVPVEIFGEGGREEDEAGPNHWHEFLATWQDMAADAGNCTDCHAGHSTDGTAQTGFENIQTTRAVCEACHRLVQEGEGRRG